MSQKNHKMTDGKLLQTDKKYAQLKLKQKEKQKKNKLLFCQKCFMSMPNIY